MRHVLLSAEDEGNLSNNKLSWRVVYNVLLLLLLTSCKASSDSEAEARQRCRNFLPTYAKLRQNYSAADKGHNWQRERGRWCKNSIEQQGQGGEIGEVGDRVRANNVKSHNTTKLSDQERKRGRQQLRLPLENWLSMRERVRQKGGRGGRGGEKRGDCLSDCGAEVKSLDIMTLVLLSSCGSRRWSGKTKQKRRVGEARKGEVTVD